MQDLLEYLNRMKRQSKKLKTFWKQIPKYFRIVMR
jgi:hypothetical protein